MKNPALKCPRLFILSGISAGVPLGVQLHMEEFCRSVDFGFPVTINVATAFDRELLSKELLEFVFQVRRGRLAQAGSHFDGVDSPSVLASDLEFNVIDAIGIEGADERFHHNLESLIWNAVTIRKARQDDEGSSWFHDALFL